MRRLPPISNRPNTLFPYTTLFRSPGPGCGVAASRPGRGSGPSRRGRGRGSARGTPGPRQPPGLPAGLAPSAPSTSLSYPAPALGWPVTSGGRSEEHTSELQSLMRISYAVFCLQKKINNNNKKVQTRDCGLALIYLTQEQYSTP